MPFFGEIIALSTVLCWTLSVQFFEAAAKRVGPTPVNIIRLFAAVAFFSGLLLLREGMLIPLHFPAEAWLMLSLSGIIGFFIGDIFLFKALVELGPRITMLIQSLTAPTAALIGWCFLNEHYLPIQWTGMLITLAGVSVVVLERGKKLDTKRKRKSRKVTPAGVLYGILAMVGQASGLVLSKIGMQTETGYLDAFAATQIRAIAAFICFVLFFTLTGRWQNVYSALKDKRAVALTVTGSAMGPFLGVSLSLLALHYLAAGVASTFFSLIPICIIPFSFFLHKEHVSLRAVLGAITAVAGVYMLVS